MNHGPNKSGRVLAAFSCMISSSGMANSPGKVRFAYAFPQKNRNIECFALSIPIVNRPLNTETIKKTTHGKQLPLLCIRAPCAVLEHGRVPGSRPPRVPSKRRLVGVPASHQTRPGARRPAVQSNSSFSIVRQKGRLFCTLGSAFVYVIFHAHLALDCS